jgi:hypothetical protein
MATKILPPIDYLRECFRYEPETGLLYWNERPASHFRNRGARAAANRHTGNLAGVVQRDGHLRIKLDRQLYSVHRIVWKLSTAQEPPDMLDHINGNGADNRMTNLRPATNAQNQHNRTAPPHSTLKIKGVVWRERDQRFQAQIRAFGKRVYLGYFKTENEARAAYCAAAEKLHGQFARTD